MNRRAATGIAVVAGLLVLLGWTLRPRPEGEAPAPAPPPPRAPREEPPPPSGPVSLRGRVVDQDGRPVAGARLQMVEAAAGAPPGAVEAGGDGGFSFPPVARREWTLRVMPPEPPEGTAWVERGPRRRVTADGSPVDVVLEHRRVGGAAVEVAVVDGATGEAATPAVAVFQPRDGIPLEWSLLATRVETRAGGLSVAAAEPGWWRAWARLADGRVAYGDVRVPEGADRVEARLVAGEPGRVEGRVALEGFPDGDPQGLEVRAAPAAGLTFPVFATRAAGAQAEPTAAARVGEDGTFAIEGLLPGRLLVSVLRRDAAAAAEVDLAPGGTAEVALEPVPAAILRFRAEGIPVPGFAFLTTVHDRMGMQFAERRPVEEDGTVEVEVPSHPGRVSWRLGFGADPERGSLVDLVPVREGEVEAVSGETVEIRVPGGG